MSAAATAASLWAAAGAGVGTSSALAPFGPAMPEVGVTAPGLSNGSCGARAGDNGGGVVATTRGEPAEAAACGSVATSAGAGSGAGAAAGAVEARVEVSGGGAAVATAWAAGDGGSRSWAGGASGGGGSGGARAAGGAAGERRDCNAGAGTGGGGVAEVPDTGCEVAPGPDISWWRSWSAAAAGA